MKWGEALGYVGRQDPNPSADAQAQQLPAANSTLLAPQVSIGSGENRRYGIEGNARRDSQVTFESARQIQATFPRVSWLDAFPYSSNPYAIKVTCVTEVTTGCHPPR